MSEFNKEQLYILILNFFTVIGLLGAYHMLTLSYTYFLDGLYGSMFYELAFGIPIGIIAMWLLFTSIKKGVDELIELYMPNGFGDIIKQLEASLEDAKIQIEAKKKEIKSNSKK